MLGLRRSDIPTEPAGKATFGRGTRSRMAGDRLPLELLVPGYSPEPYISGSDLRDELRPRELNQLTGALQISVKWVKLNHQKVVHPLRVIVSSLRPQDWPQMLSKLLSVWQDKPWGLDLKMSLAPLIFSISSLAALTILTRYLNNHVHDTCKGPATIFLALAILIRVSNYG